MIYLICFILSIVTLFYLIANGKGVDINATILNLIIVVGNGGYYALYDSQNLTEAILANKITYIIGCFAPMIMFLIICDLCRINISTHVQMSLYLVQTLVYLCVCTTGKLGIFYKSVEYVAGPNGATLDKVYGPMHTAYIGLLFIYMAASIIVVGISIKKKRCRVSDTVANALLFLFLGSAILYFVERFAHISFEAMPLIFTVTNFFVILIIINITGYSAYGNISILEDKNKEVAYIIFNRKLLFMSCNDYALQLFPELTEWEIGRVIPGNGGRFNTFLRIPFMNYVNAGSVNKDVSSYEYKGINYRVEIKNLHSIIKRKKGYVIEVSFDKVVE